MTLLLSNDDVQLLLHMPECLEALEDAYREHAALRAVNRPRTDIYAPHADQDGYYVFKSMDAVLPSAGVAALRLNSDVITWSAYAGAIRKDKQPLAGGRWVGLVLLFSTRTGEPLAIFPDGVVQRMRVGATSGLGARYLACEDARVYGLLGAGWQAGSQLMAMAAVRRLDEVRVFSPDESHRTAFAEEWSEKLGLPVRAVASAREAADGADILGTATSALRPVVEPEWLRPGMYLTCVKSSELGAEVLARCDRVVIHTRNSVPQNYLVGVGDVMVPAQDPIELMDRLRAGQPVGPAELQATADSAESFAHASVLSEVVNGDAPARADADEITAFVNNIGLGIQFAALGALVYQKAVKRGVGRQLPTEWLTEDVHP